MLLYEKIVRGFRAGEFNMRGGTPIALLTFYPENVTSFELAAKAESLSHLLLSNVSVYRSNYHYMQLFATLPYPIQSLTFI